jgi:hypothetical protein
MSMTAPAHLLVITLLSANDSKLTMCWQLGTYIHQGNGDRAVEVQREYNILRVLTFSLRPKDLDSRAQPIMFKRSSFKLRHLLVSLVFNGPFSFIRAS